MTKEQKYKTLIEAIVIATRHGITVTFEPDEFGQLSAQF